MPRSWWLPALLALAVFVGFGCGYLLYLGVRMVGG
jgi:predicted Co/Zn/Cd cation transporter (cation efflux family)